MHTTASLRRKWLNLAAAFAAIVSTQLPFRSFAATDALTEAGRNAIRSELQQLQDRFIGLRKDPNVTSDHWADAQVFVKGITWALDFEPAIEGENRKLVQKALRRAHERLDALAAGRHPWAEKRAGVVRGFVSAVDGST